MKQYLITGYDYKDEQALERRMQVRDAHLEGAKKLKESNNFIVGGAMLSDEGKMIGSTLVLQFKEESELKQWMEEEPYIIHKVWETVEVKTFRVANV
jgi:uncharacterized protein YciI